MSKEAMGQNGALLGSSGYWERVNRATFLGGLMRQSGYGYWETLGAVAGRANNAVSELQQDLREKADSLSTLSDSRRNSLEKLARGLYDVCRMGGGTASQADNCISLLQGAGMFQNSLTSSSPAAEKAVKKLKNDSRFFASECVELVEKAADWGIGFAAGSDKNKREFLEEVSQGKGKAFFQEVLEAYKHTAKPVDLRGRCGYEIGSSDYLTHFERSVFGQDLPSSSSVRWGSPGYTALLRDSLEHIFREVERDLDVNARENNYITDTTAEALRAAAKELERCGVGGMLESKIEKLAWFVGGDPAKIRQLQGKLNQLGVGERLSEDGVYGRKTNDAIESFMDRLARGAAPILTLTDPLQSNLTGITTTIKTTKGGQEFAQLVGTGSSAPIFRADRHMYNGNPLYYHINVDAIPNASPLQRNMAMQLDHVEISKEAYDLLKNFDNSAKVVRCAGRVLVVAGIALDVLTLLETAIEDKTDADKKLGRKTYTAVASVGGSWVGGALGAKGGAMAGAAIGTAILPGIGTAIGGLAGGLILGVAGSFAGSAFGEWVVDITEIGE